MLFSLSALVIFTSCGEDGEDEPEPEPEPTETIYQLIESTGGLDSLKKYLDFYPDLVATLSGSGDFTLFAPDNNAFVGLLATPGFPADIRSINPDIVKTVLAYHVSASRFEAADLASGTTVSTVQGESITVNEDGTLLTGATNAAISVTTADIKATNGVMHVLASVMIPPTVGASLTPILGTNAGTLLLGANFSDLATGIGLADAFAAEAGVPTLVSILAGQTTHTVFAPTNETFAAAAAGAGVTVEQFVASLTGQQWYGIIANHVVLDTVEPTDLVTGATFPTALEGSQLLVFNNTEAIPAQNGLGIYLDSDGNVDLQDPTTYTGFNAEVVAPASAIGTVAANGRVHVIAGLLTPPM